MPIDGAGAGAGADDPGAAPLDEVFRKLLGIDESFSVKSHYPRFKAAERDLVVSDARLRTMFDTVPFDMFLLGLDGTYILVNEAFKRHYGDLTGTKSSGHGVDPGTREELGRELQTAAAGTVVQRVLFVDRATPHPRWIISTLAVVSVDGQRGGVFGVNVDITEQKEAEAALQALNEQLERKVAERTEDLRLVNDDLTARSLSLERALAELRETQERLVRIRYQASVGRVLGSIAHDLNSPLASTASAAGHISSMKAQAFAAIRLLRSMPEALADLTLRLVGLPASDAGLDRKARRDLALRLEALGMEDAEDVADDLSDLGMLDPDPADLALLVGPGGRDALVSAWMLGSLFRSSSLVARSAERSADVVRSLYAYLDISQQGSLAVGEFDLAERLRALVRPPGSPPAATLELSEPLRAYGDPEQLDLVWGHLLKNALYAAGKLGRVVVRARMEGESAVVSVEDSGPGIDPSIRDKVFEPLFTTKGTGEGKGLGLDMCRRIVDTHGGSIRFESVPGRTVFFVSIPGRA